MMNDLREKVIRGLQCHSEPKQGIDECFCETCPYDELTCGLDVPADALSLLKSQQERIAELEARQEPAGIGKRVNCGDVVIGFYECGHCQNAIRKPWRYCPFCGRAVKWDG